MFTLQSITLIVPIGQVIAQDLNDDQEFFDTPEGPATMDNTFMGYSIAVGHFNNDTLPGESYTSKLLEKNCVILFITIVNNSITSCTCTSDI